MESQITQGLPTQIKTGFFISLRWDVTGVFSAGDSDGLTFFFLSGIILSAAWRPMLKVLRADSILDSP